MFGRKLSAFFIISLLFTISLAWADQDVRQAQIALQQKGIDPGPIDGIMGPQTRRALREFQMDHELTVTGDLDLQTRQALGITSEIQNSGGVATLPEGYELNVRLLDRLDSAHSRAGEDFSMVVSENIYDGSKVVIPEGTVVHGIVSEVESAKRPEKPGKIRIRPTDLEVRGRTVPIDGRITAPGRDLEGEGSLKEDWKKIAAGAGLGALIGGLAKGGTGALAGVLIGGAGTFIATKGEQVELDRETPLIVQLQGPLRVPVP